MENVGVILFILGTILLIVMLDRRDKQLLNSFGFLLLGLGLGLISNAFSTNHNIDPSQRKAFYDNFESLVISAAAIGALIISIWQGIESRYSNRKSVLPSVSIHWNGTFNNRPGMHLHNNGIGPAIIKDIFVFYNEKPIEGNTNTERFTKFFKLCVPHPSSEITTTIIKNDRVLNVDADLEIIGFNRTVVVKDPSLIVKELIYKSVWEIHYTDIYGTEFKAIEQYKNNVTE